MESKFSHEDLMQLGFAYKKNEYEDEMTTRLSHYYIDFFSGLSLVYVENEFLLCSQVNTPVKIAISDKEELEQFIDMATMNRVKYLCKSLLLFVKNLVFLVNNDA